MASRPRFVITDYQFPSVDTEKKIIEAAGFEIADFQCKTEDDVIAACTDAAAILVQWAPISRAVIQCLKNCQVIVRYGIGLDNIDLAAAKDRGITIRNVPDYCIDEVADHSFALAITLARQLAAIDRQVRSGIWKIVPPRPMLASRQTIFTTIGFGRIGRAILSRARAFNFKLATCDPYLADNHAIPDDIQRLSFEEALEMTDIFSLNLPLTEETGHIINAKALSSMKPNALLVNTARGGLVDTTALARALEEGRIAGAGLDVFEHEPLEANHPIRQCPNALLTSHVSWYSELSGPKLQAMAAEEAVRHVRPAALAVFDNVQSAFQRDGSQP